MKTIRKLKEAIALYRLYRGAKNTPVTALSLTLETLKFTL